MITLNPSYPPHETYLLAVLSAHRQLCVAHASCTPSAPRLVAKPKRCNQHNRRSSHSRDNCPTAATVLPAYGWWCSRTTRLSCRAGRCPPPHPGLAGRVAIRFFQHCPHASSQRITGLSSNRSHIKFSSGWKCPLQWITQHARVRRGISIPSRLSTISKRCTAGRRHAWW